MRILEGSGTFMNSICRVKSAMKRMGMCGNVRECGV